MTTKPNILVVDDELVERQSLTEILRLEGYRVSSVANGEAAIDFIRQNPVELILLDLRMTGMSGIDVIKVINRTFPEIEIILLTAYGSMESAIEALRNNVQDYLLKPASPNQILESVSRGLARRARKLQSQDLKEISPELDNRGVINIGNGIEIDFSRRLVCFGLEKIFLTPAEGRLLRIFIENTGKVLTHRELVLLVQGYSTSQVEAPEVLRPLVSRLRKKVAGIPTLMRRIVSVRGTGYIFEIFK